jgi:hypothetical protein
VISSDFSSTSTTTAWNSATVATFSGQLYVAADGFSWASNQILSIAVINVASDSASVLRSKAGKIGVKEVAQLYSASEALIVSATSRCGFKLGSWTSLFGVEISGVYTSSAGKLCVVVTILERGVFLVMMASILVVALENIHASSKMLSMFYE